LRLSDTFRPEPQRFPVEAFIAHATCRRQYARLSAANRAEVEE
jgi:hypothetical protein